MVAVAAGLVRGLDDTTLTSLSAEPAGRLIPPGTAPLWVALPDLTLLP
jgi:hypothetical protein